MASKGKGKGHPIAEHEGPEEEYWYISTLSLTSAPDGGGWSTPRLGRLTPGNDSVPIVREAGWAPVSVWTGTDNLGPPPGCAPRTVQFVANRYTSTELSRPKRLGNIPHINECSVSSTNRKGDDTDSLQSVT